MNKDLDKICNEIEPVLLALGDHTRIHIVKTLLNLNCEGVRVGEITQKTHLSRPAVSHHLKILKKAEILNMRKEGTKNYYYLDSNMTKIIELKDNLETIIELINIKIER